MKPGRNDYPVGTWPTVTTFPRFSKVKVTADLLSEYPATQTVVCPHVDIDKDERPELIPTGSQASRQ